MGISGAIGRRVNALGGMMKQQHIDIIRKRLPEDRHVKGKSDGKLIRKYEGGFVHKMAMVEGFIVNVCVRVGGFIVRWTR